MSNPNNCTPPPFAPGCTTPLPLVYSLAFDKHGCSYMDGVEMRITWNGAVWRGIHDFVDNRPPFSSFHYDFVLRYIDGGFELEALGCQPDKYSVGTPCNPANGSVVPDFAGYPGCGCIPNGGFEIQIIPAS